MDIHFTCAQVEALIKYYIEGISIEEAREVFKKQNKSKTTNLEDE